MYNKNIRRILSMVLVACLFFTTMPMQVFAETIREEIQNRETQEALDINDLRDALRYEPEANMDIVEIIRESIVIDDYSPSYAEVLERIEQIFSRYDYYTELSQEQQLFLEQHLFLRQDTMTESAEAGYDLTESQQRALMMQRLNITVEQASTMIENIGEDNATSYAYRFNELRRTYGILNSFDKAYMVDLLIDGYNPYSIVFSFIAASALDLDHQSIISDDRPDFEALDLPIYTGDELEAFKNMVTIYHLDADSVLHYLNENDIAPTSVFDTIIAHQVELNMFVVHSMVQPLSDEPDIYENVSIEPGAPFALWSNSNENINLQSGMLEYESHIATIPGRNGLDLNLTLRYDTQFSSADRVYRTSQSAWWGHWGWVWNPRTFTYVWAWTYTYWGQTPINRVVVNDMMGETPFETMGVGWFLNFPRVIINDRTDTRHLRLASGSTYEFYEGATHSNLKNYLLYDMIFEEDPHGQHRESKYILTHIDGTRMFFDGKGRIVGIRDRFNNIIDFHYDITGSFEGVVTITDTVGQITTIDYDDSGVTINLPDGSNVEYSFVRSGVYKLLNSKTDQMGRVTTFGYDTRTAYFDFFARDRLNFTFGSRRSAATHHLLTSVTHPSGAVTNYVYSVAMGAVETEGMYEYFRIVSRYDVAAGITYNVRTFTYSENNYTGYPTNYGMRELPGSFEYSTTVNYGNGVVRQYTFNNEHLLISETLSYNGVVKIEEHYTYDERKQRLSHTTITHGSDGISQTVSEQYYFDEFGNIVAFWSRKAHGDRDNTEHKKTFVYDPNYNMLISISYKQNEDTYIREVFDLTSDGKSIASHRMYETIDGTIRRIAQADFTYDVYGNVLSRTEHVSPGTSIVTYFEYQNGVFLTSETRAGRALRYTFDIMGRMLSQTDGNGNTTSFQYDKLGRLIRQTNPGTPAVSTFITVYDDVNNTITTTDEIGRRMKYTFDMLGNLKLVQDVTHGVITLTQNTYDNLMRLTGTTDARNTVTAYTHDFLDRITSKTIGSPALYTEIYEFEDAYSSIHSRVTTTIVGDSNAPSIVTRMYTNLYGNVDRRSRVIGNTEYFETFAFDYMGNNTKTTTADGRVTRFSYDSSN